MNLRRDALTIFRAALAAADAGNAVRHAWRAATRLADPRKFDRVFLLSAGKGAASMADSVRKLLPVAVTSGIVVTKHGHITHRIPGCVVLEAGHPVPDAAGLQAVQQVHSLLSDLNARDLLIVALSGGASALLSAPLPGLTLQDKQRTTELLLRAGAGIGELNAVRKHLSTLKGVRLAALAYPATVLSLVLSDVIGDPLDVIASGPTAPDPTTFADALAVLKKFDILDTVPAAVRAHLERGEMETPKPGDEFFGSVHNMIVGSNRLALKAAQKKAKQLGYRPLILASTLAGEARELGSTHAAVLREIVQAANPLRAPACVLSGGEPTVTVRGEGKGGRAQEFALAAALALQDLPDCLLLSAGTDGTDGPTDAAGAFVTGETLACAHKLGLDPSQYLARNDAYHFFDAVGGLVKTGPTGTNVMDVNICLAK